MRCQRQYIQVDYDLDVLTRDMNAEWSMVETYERKICLK